MKNPPGVVFATLILLLACATGVGKPQARVHPQFGAHHENDPGQECIDGPLSITTDMSGWTLRLSKHSWTAFYRNARKTNRNLHFFSKEFI